MLAFVNFQLSDFVGHFTAFPFQLVFQVTSVLADAFIPRALKEWPRIELIDDVAGNQFSAVIWRPAEEWVATPPVTGEVTDEVQRLLLGLQGEMKRADIQAVLGLKHEDHFRETYLRPALDSGFIEMTIPDKPRSRLQKYRLTSAGQAWLRSQRS